ncbi:SDR family oxidoreductase [Desulfovibrio mangrovi]|uniref:SDR family NAD(P)-dependent oxidoreductase n=1 Tax=Desulfovibrio mangrovi TaxID=2976983 RepID=UPI002246F396|nr:SDR family oxidoreductase [Desulfovibrio mangrovi]UZP66732.1 SDR family oxidoreductase [Desulfovibrio mangrovi]
MPDHALILGGCTIGQHLARLLLNEGRHVTITVSSKRRVAELRAALALPEEQGCRLRVIPLQLEIQESVDSAMTQILANGTPNRVADCMHPHLEGLIAAVEPDDAAAYFAAAVSARHRIMHGLTRAMLTGAKGRRSAGRQDNAAGNLGRRVTGRLVYLSSTAAAMPNAGQGFYAAAKSAAEALFRSIGVELAPRGITTTTLRAGYVDAGRGARYLTEHPEALRAVPLGRALAPEEVAATLHWLLSEAATGINATVITMDGGMTACK